MNGKSNQGAMGSGDGNMAGNADGYRSDSLSSSDHLKVSIGDGIDIDHSKNVRIANCHITSV